MTTVEGPDRSVRVVRVGDQDLKACGCAGIHALPSGAAVPCPTRTGCVVEDDAAGLRVTLDVRLVGGELVAQRVTVERLDGRASGVRATDLRRVPVGFYCAALLAAMLRPVTGAVRAGQVATAAQRVEDPGDRAAQVTALWSLLREDPRHAHRATAETAERLGLSRAYVKRLTAPTRKGHTP